MVASVAGADFDIALGGLALGNACFSILNAVVKAVAQQMHEGILERLHNAALNQGANTEFSEGDDTDDVRLQVNGQADVVIYATDSKIMNAIARAYIRAVSWLTYAY